MIKCMVILKIIPRLFASVHFSLLTDHPTCRRHGFRHTGNVCHKHVNMPDRIIWNFLFHLAVRCFMVRRDVISIGSDVCHKREGVTARKNLTARLIQMHSCVPLPGARCLSLAHSEITFVSECEETLKS